VLVGHFPREGRGGEDNYAVYGNFFYQNRHEALFQGEGNVALYANVFVNEHGDGLRIQPHNDVPRRIVIAFNTVLARDAGIVVTPKEGVPLLQQEVFANAVFAGMPFATVEGSRNVQAPLESAPSYLKRPLSPLGELDLHPSGNWAAAASGDTIGGKSLPDWGLDFDGVKRAPRGIGAYVGTTAGEAWSLQLERKPGGGSAKGGPDAARR
jgi:hypothetical protein